MEMTIAKSVSGRWVERGGQSRVFEKNLRRALWIIRGQGYTRVIVDYGGVQRKRVEVREVCGECDSFSCGGCPTPARD